MMKFGRQKARLFFLSLVFSSIFNCANSQQAPSLGVSFSANPSAQSVVIQSGQPQVIGQFSYHSDGTQGFDIIISSANNARMRLPNGKGVSYVLSGSVNGIFISNQGSTTLSAAAGSATSLTQNLIFTSSAVMDNTPTNPQIILSGTYSDEITATVSPK